ncbi:hypothetical protein TH66_01820 [Carbonactinospora thermoautotrophica]|uniref:Methylmalonyl-CoA mutase alpha/beta chain catalytic domain-containing protein n=1 Tax=Carbonactinospora thermoautotrophica TaxID=1469144 RepID=A0A132NAP2_9ACTN|nr:methylmalonyl-CoA mutase family protein [Carbonactinospora thermoautotrophica]KWX05461.1 hypothetical protein TH66_01820 [Carbonactinospora thermoautotrophica]KWX07090.1 hypothetical protein TR74_19890 [Carbonactinospora thermoautotrophica]
MPGRACRQLGALAATVDLEDDDARHDVVVVQAALAGLHDAARAGDNVVGPCVRAVRAYATVGKIVGVLREVHGRWQPATTF